MRCSPPDSVPASCLRRSPSRGNSPYASSSAALHLRAPAAAAERELEVLLDRERREHRPALGRVHDAEPRELVTGCQPVTSSPSKRTVPVRRRDEPGAHARDRRLARAVRTEQREHAPGQQLRTTRRTARGTARSRRRRRRARAAARPRDRDSARRRLAITPCLRGRPCAPRRRRTRRRSARTRSRVPKSSTNTRSTNDRTSSTSCSTSRIANPCSRCTSRSVRGERRRSRRGRARRRLVEQQQLAARSSAPGRPRPGGRRRGSATRPAGRRPRRARAARASLGRALLLVARRAAPTEHVLPAAPPRPLRARSATRKCSRGDMPANSSMRWNVRPMPSRARRCVGTRVRSLPSNVIVPCVGRQDAEQAVEERRLARAVRTDEPDDLAARRRRGSTSSSAVMPANFFVTPDASSRLIAALRPARRSTPGRRAAVRRRRCRARRAFELVEPRAASARATCACCARARLRGAWRR